MPLARIWCQRLLIDLAFSFNVSHLGSRISAKNIFCTGAGISTSCSVTLRPRGIIKASGVPGLHEIHEIYYDSACALYVPCGKFILV